MLESRLHARERRGKNAQPLRAFPQGTSAPPATETATPGSGHIVIQDPAQIPSANHCLFKRMPLLKSRHLKRIVTFQKKAIRIVAKVPFDSHTDPIFRDLEVLKFSNVVLFHLGKFMFFFSKGFLPNSFNDMFTLANYIHPYNTRNSSNSNFYIPLVRTNIRKFSIRFQGPKFFNSLDSQIKSSGSTAQFCKNLKRFLLYP